MMPALHILRLKRSTKAKEEISCHVRTHRCTVEQLTTRKEYPNTTNEHALKTLSGDGRDVSTHPDDHRAKRKFAHATRENELAAPNPSNDTRVVFLSVP